MQGLQGGIELAHQLGVALAHAGTGAIAQDDRVFQLIGCKFKRLSFGFVQKTHLHFNQIADQGVHTT